MSDIAAPVLAVELSRLPAPQVVQPLDYETIRAQLIEDFRTRWPLFDALLESDPAIKLLEVAAYRELLLRAVINDAARSVMLAFASGPDLDQIAARHGVARRLIMAATDDQPALYESDDELRRRAQLAAERLPYAGMTGGGYVTRALAAAPSVKDVALVKRDGGRIDVILLGRDGDGAVSAPVVQAVYRALAEEDAAQLTDIVSVRAAEILRYSANVVLLVRRGPDPELVRAAAVAAIRAYAADRHRVGLPVYAQRMAAAASVGGVERATIDIDDILPGPAQAAWLEALAVTLEYAA